MAGTSPTQRTLKVLKEEGWRSGIVERFVGPLNIRVDLFHIIDIIAIQERRILGVQSCGQAFAEHHRKLTEEELLSSLDWLRACGELQLWGWRKVKVKRGGKAMVWKPRVREYTLTLDGQGLEWEDRGEEADSPRSA